MTKAEKQALVDKYGDEEVLVIPNSAIPNSIKDKFVYCSETVIEFVLDNSKFAPRGTSEMNTRLRQVIPYLLIRANGKFVATKRLSGSGESRLVEKISLGIGGHINPIDKDGFGANTIENALLRELSEEVEIPTGASFEFQFVGLINDTSDEVGKVHIGAMYVADIKFPEGEITIKESDKLELEMKSITEITQDYNKLENWSKIVFDNFISRWGVK